jgi:hypothetical protein
MKLTVSHTFRFHFVINHAKLSELLSFFRVLLFPNLENGNNPTTSHSGFEN